PQPRRQYSRRRYDRYFSPKRIMLFALIMVSITSLVIFIYHYANAYTLRTINLSHVSLYMRSETEHALKLNIATLTPLAQRIPNYE
ncbi:TPA: transcriptional regulator, partial [Aeromonas salmonicida]